MKFADWVEVLVDRAGRSLFVPMRKANRLGQTMFFDPDKLTVTKELRDNFPQIQAELLEILKRRDEFPPSQSVSPHQKIISDDDRWKMFFFKGLGHVFERNAAQAPITMGILNKHEDIISVYLSVLAPRRYLNPHQGPTAAILGYHLGIDIPPGDLCTLVVGGEAYKWKNGDFVLFDDTYEHFAVNESYQSRAILFMQVLRPMPPFWSAVARFMMWLTRLLPYFKIPVKLHREWERSFYAD